MNNLLSIKRGKTAEIVGISDKASIKIKRRLLELGFTSGQKVKVVRKSLLGRAYLIELRGYTLSMRSDILGLLLVKDNDLKARRI